MTSPLRLPQTLKNFGRKVRDFPATNNLITSALRPLINWVPSGPRETLMAHIPRVGSASAELPNGKTLHMFCPEAEAILNSLFYGDWTASEVLPLWFELAKQAAVVVDIGAHVGHFSLVAGLANLNSQIFSFEPLPRIFLLLRENARLNGVENINIRPLALGRTAGKLPFYAAPQGVPSSSSLSKEFMQSGGEEFTETLVEISTLDSQNISREFSVIMKIDTETTEPDVIAGGRDFIRHTKPLMFIEILNGSDSGASLNDELRQADFEYDAFLLTGGGAIPKDDLAGDPVWRNYLLVPKEKSTILDLIPVLDRFGITYSR
jgi:FkbM family methyltransferase